MTDYSFVFEWILFSVDAYLQIEFPYGERHTR